MPWCTICYVCGSFSRDVISDNICPKWGSVYHYVQDSMHVLLMYRISTCGTSPVLITPAMYHAYFLWEKSLTFADWMFGEGRLMYGWVLGLRWLPSRLLTRPARHKRQGLRIWVRMLTSPQTSDECLHCYVPVLHLRRHHYLSYEMHLVSTVRKWMCTVGIQIDSTLFKQVSIQLRHRAVEIWAPCFVLNLCSKLFLQEFLIFFPSLLQICTYFGIRLSNLTIVGDRSELA